MIENPLKVGLLAAGEHFADREAEATRVVALAAPRTRDIVQLARAVWAAAQPRGEVRPGAADAAFETVVQEQSELFRGIFSRLTVRQQAVLRAFAAEPGVEITAAATLREYGLGPKSTVHSTVETLVGNEHLTRREDGGYTFDDPFFRRWVQVQALPDIGLEPPLLRP